MASLNGVQAQDITDSEESDAPQFTQISDTTVAPLLTDTNDVVLDTNGAVVDSTGAVADSLAQADLLDSLKRNAQFDAPVNYEASDSVVFDLQNDVLNLYQDGRITFDKMDMKAHRIRMDMQAKVMTANGLADSLGQLSGTPEFLDDGQEFSAEQVKYNYETGKARVIYSRTIMQEQYVIGPVSRRNPDNTFFVEGGRFTTCDHEHPHFYIASRKLKMIPEDRIISGPLYMAIGDVPLPLVIPFGFFPMTESRSSGLVFPEFGEALDRGFFLRNLGFYVPASDHLDLMLVGDIYSKGGWRVRGLTQYNKRYAYQGLFSLEYSLLSVNFPEDEGFTDPAFNYREERNIFVQWDHNQTISPQSSLRASVHAGSANALRRNGFGQDVLRSDLRSTIAYQTAFPRLGANLTFNLSHQQNLNPTNEPEWDLPVRMMTLNLPDIAFNKDRIFPFKNPNRGGSARWYDKIGLTYSTQLRNQIRVPDSLLFSPEALDHMSNGMLHTANLNTNVKVAQFITLTPAVSYREFWYLSEVQKSFVPSVMNPERDSLVTEQLQNGFHAGREFSFSLNASTTMYGVSPELGKRGTKIRHTLIPNLSYTYRPDFSTDNWGIYRTVSTEDSLFRDTRYSRFEGFLFGGPSMGEQQRLGLQLQNLWEMKYFKKDAAVDSTTGKKQATYLQLIDNFGSSATYNLAADSLRMSLINTELRANVANNRLNINLRAIHDVYGYQESDSATGRLSPFRVNELQVQQDGKLARLVNASFALGTTLRSARRTKSNIVNTMEDPNAVPGMHPGMDDDMDENPDGKKKEPKPKTHFQNQYDKMYTPSALEWSLNTNYTLSYDRPFGPQTEGLRHSLNLSGSFKPTPMWELRFNANYDLENMEFAYTTVDITRDLHCWQMSFNWIPFGIRQSYLITINVKSQVLQDLKVTKRRDWRDTFIDF